MPVYSPRYRHECEAPERWRELWLAVYLTASEQNRDDLAASMSRALAAPRRTRFRELWLCCWMVAMDEEVDLRARQRATIRGDLEAIRHRAGLAYRIADAPLRSS